MGPLIPLFCTSMISALILKLGWFSCLLSCLHVIPQIHLWYDTCQLLDSQHGSWLCSLHVFSRGRMLGAGVETRNSQTMSRCAIHSATATNFIFDFKLNAHEKYFNVRNYFNIKKQKVSLFLKLTHFFSQLLPFVIMTSVPQNVISKVGKLQMEVPRNTNILLLKSSSFHSTGIFHGLYFVGSIV